MQTVEKEQYKDNKDYASLSAAGINLIKTFIGAGILMVPLTFPVYGYGLSMILIFISGITSWLGLWYYTLLASQLGRKSSPLMMAKATMPKLWYLPDLFVILKTWGVCLAYLLLASEILASIFKDINSEIIKEYGHQIWIILIVIIVAPLCFLRKFKSLRYSSFLGTFSILYLTSLLIYEMVINKQIVELKTRKLSFIMPVSTNMFSYYGIFVFAFTCHQQVYIIYNECEDNRLRSLGILYGTSIIISGIVYLIFGSLNYLIYRDAVLDKSIFDIYPNNIAYKIAKILIAILLMASYPLQVFPCRESVGRILDKNTWFVKDMASLFVLLSTMFLSLFKTRANKVLSLIGTGVSSYICYIFPAFFYLNSSLPAMNRGFNITKLVAILLFIYGILVFLLCTGFSIMKLINDPA